MMKLLNKKIVKNIVMVMAVMMLCPALNVSANHTDWGLGYPTPGTTPQGNESVDYLQKFDAYFVGDASEKVIYLTFDAGYENGYTETILDTLKDKEVPATFFLVGTYIRDNPDLVKRMIKEGHIIGNHTMQHPDMTKLSDKEAFKKELEQVEEQYKAVTGQEMMKFYRPPGGKYSEINMQIAKELGYKTIFWSLAYADWDANKQPTKDQAFSKLIPRVHPGTVLLLHNTSKTNSVILGELIDRYHDMGYEFKSLTNLTI